MGKVRVGLIGAGNIAKQHLKVIGDIDSIEVVSVTSRTRLKAEQLAKEYNIELCFDTAEEMVEKSNLNGLLVLVSENQICNVVKRVSSYRLPLFIEKPPGLSSQETARLAELANKYSIKTMVGFNRRYYSVFHKGIELINKHGPLMAVAVTGHERMWRIREGKKFSEEILDKWVFANSTHTIDLLRFFGGDVRNVKSIVHSYREKNGDQFSSIMELESGAIGQYNSFWYSPGGWSVTLYGNGIIVEFKPLEKGRFIDKQFKTYDIEPDEIDIKHKPGFFNQMKAFERLIKSKSHEWPMLNLDEAYKTMVLAEQISSESKNCRNKA